MNDFNEWTAHDVLVFTFRDKYPELWSEADDFANELIATLNDHRYLIVPDGAT